MSEFAATATSSRWRRLGGALAGGRLQDIALALLAVVIISLMVLPLPPSVLDSLIAVNIGISILLLMSAMYVTSPLGLSTFPTLLLFTTLFRLSLNIASTRAILLHAHAGDIIETFGRLVVGGNVVVGIVVFVIIAIVQFLVIAKGSERVAEVGARFTLDALPGKQMAIDAEQRAGLIDKEESRSKRALLQQESQLYGAMDGAMKFVKGDAIAGLLIALVNILAGIAIGIGMRDMAVGEAVRTYTVLTVGDGLVTQIPSLFVSLAAGLLITRVSSDADSGATLGRQIGAEIAAHPKAVLLTAGALMMFVLVPGFPKLQFTAAAAVLALAGLLLIRRRREQAGDDPMSAAVLHRDGIGRHRTGVELEGELVTSYPLTLRLSPSLRSIVDSGAIVDEVERIRRRVTRRLGVPFPGIGLAIAEDTSRGDFTILVSDVPVGGGLVPDGRIYVPHSPERLIALGVDAADLQRVAAGDRTVGCWVESDWGPALTDAGVATLTPAAFIGSALGSVVSRRLGDFIGLQEVRYLLSEAEKSFPDLVAETSRVVPIMRLTEVLRRLVEENVSIRNLRDILQAMLDWAPREKDGVLLTEQVRAALARQISHQATRGTRQLVAIGFESSLEDEIRAGIRPMPAGNFFVLDPERAEAIAGRVRSALGTDAGSGAVATVDSRVGGGTVVLVSMDIRRYVRSLLISHGIEASVLSYQDLSPEVRVEMRSRIRS